MKTTIRLRGHHSQTLPTQPLFLWLSLLSPYPTVSSTSFFISLTPPNSTQLHRESSTIPSHQLTPSLRLSNNPRPSLANRYPSGQYFHLLTFLFSSISPARPVPAFLRPRASLRVHCPSSFPTSLASPSLLFSPSRSHPLLMLHATLCSLTTRFIFYHTHPNTQQPSLGAAHLHSYPRLLPLTASNRFPLISPTHFPLTSSTPTLTTSHPLPPTAFHLLPPPFRPTTFHPLTSLNHFRPTPISRPPPPTASHPVPPTAPPRTSCNCFPPTSSSCLSLSSFNYLPPTNLSTTHQPSHSFLTHYLLLPFRLPLPTVSTPSPPGQTAARSHFYFSILRSRRFQSLHFGRRCHRDVQQTGHHFSLGFRFLAFRAPLLGLVD